MAQLFLSYANEDFDRARNLAHALLTLGWDVWWDRNIPAGRVFEEVIEEAIDASHCVVVLWSASSVNSRWVKTEASEGANRQILVPVQLDDSRIPLAFRQIQTADFSEWDGDDDSALIKELAESIQHVIDRAGHGPNSNVVSFQSRLVDIQIVERDDDIPNDVGGVVIEQDTGLVLNTDDEIRYPRDSIETLTKNMLRRGEPAQGTVLELGTSPPQLLAIVHNLDNEPSWTEEIVKETITNLFKIAKRREFHSIAMPLLGTVHGDLAEERAQDLLEEAVSETRVPKLRKIWILKR